MFNIQEHTTRSTFQIKDALVLAVYGTSVDWSVYFGRLYTLVKRP
jgi:hypothetical protein